MSEDVCERFREQLGLYVYRELSETTAIERHLAECSVCRQELDATRRALAVIDRASLDSAPEGVAEAVISEVLARVRPASKPTTGRRRLRAVAMVAASLLTVAVGAWFFLRTTGGESVTRLDHDLELETQAVATEAEAVLRLLDELEEENDVLARLLGMDGVEDPGVEPDGKKEEKESV